MHSIELKVTVKTFAVLQVSNKCCSVQLSVRQRILRIKTLDDFHRCVEHRLRLVSVELLCPHDQQKLVGLQMCGSTARSLAGSQGVLSQRTATGLLISLNWKVPVSESDQILKTLKLSSVS